MQNNPLISIIIPTYNRAHLISETLDSVLAQTYTNWECIVVDDSSTDDTENVVKAYVKKDNRFQFHKRPSNKPKGANACRNYGFEICNGEFINWFDSDDLMHEDKLKIQIAQMIESNKVLAVCQTMVFEGDISNLLGLRKDKIYSKDFFNDFITNEIKWLTQSPIIKKTFLLEKKITFDESLHQSQERDYFVRLLSYISDYDVEEKPLVYFRKHENSISYGKYDSNKLISRFKVNCNILSIFNQRLNEYSKNYVN
jgi:glycosyltransferase involved in cell wall biosynthesis